MGIIKAYQNFKIRKLDIEVITTRDGLTDAVRINILPLEAHFVDEYA